MHSESGLLAAMLDESSSRNLGWLRKVMVGMTAKAATLSAKSFGKERNAGNQQG